MVGSDGTVDRGGVETVVLGRCIDDVEVSCIVGRVMDADRGHFPPG